MKITIITGIYPPDIGGPATFSKQMLNWLQDKEISSRVLTLKNKESESNSSNVIFIQRSRYLPLRILKAIPIILKNIYKKQIICTGLYEETGLCIWIIKKLFNSKNLYLARVVGDPVWERYSNKYGGSGEKINEFELDNITGLQRKLLTWSLNQFNLIICPSEELKNLCRTWGVKSDIKIISNGLEPKNNGSNNSDKKYDFITVSRIVSWKNLDFIVEKCIEINASLLIVGDGPELNNMREKYKNANLINFTGRCDENEVRKRLAQSRNFINASIYEGMSFSTLEAISTGMPIYVSDIPGNSQIMKDFYLTKLNLENADEISKIMRDGLINQTQQEKKSLGNVEIFNKLYSFDAMASQYLELMKI
jgi:glycosyltransferase involved in cell wall biosynthesis